MVNYLIGLYGVYVFIKILLEIREVFFIKNEFEKGPILLNLEDFKTSAIYSIYKHTFEIFNSLISLFLVIFWLSGGLFILNFLFYDGSLIGELKILGVFFLVNYLLTLPIHIWQKHIDKKFGFNVAPWKIFFIDEIKKVVLFIVFGGLFFAGLIYFIDNFKNWWFIGFIFSFIVIILINILYPFFAAWFNKFEPLKDEELKSSIEEMMQKVGFKSSGIFVMDASKRDTRLNAYFAGLGKSKRVVLFDTLLKKLNKNEILAVLGHELGHFKHKDIIKNIAVMGFVLFIIFYIFGHLPDKLFVSLGIPKVGVNIIILMLLFSDMIMFILQPIINLISRHNEFAADEMGSNLVSKKDLHSALTKLVKENKHFPKVSKFYSFIYYSHPPILERLERLKEDESINNGNK
ncbi:M48 family metallopeptidase [Caminibacter mediatlanticus TB-2]|uniref:M48 family metallopeptidase n=1 Tax=Caminibacter mediatlanticus TB-2 TaxID=391592 RepID=A0ABX5V8E2_9BACT|nr:M48 family metallopeptidase [Caminibacter mediatlanticus]QCT94547.1 M48 family metallopeptidase [Caminibacter mediatlanticus TB-2]